MEFTTALVERVREAVVRHTRRTPLLRSEWLSSCTGANVYLKCENLQDTGSFKLRGAVAALSMLSPSEGSRGVVASSAGNHGLGLARASARLGVSCTVVVPRSAPQVKIRGMEREGAKVIRSPHDGYDDTEAWALDHLQDWGGVFISPYDSPPVMAGNGGTVMLEILEEIPRLDTLVVPCGGGGLAVGAGTVVRERSSTTRVVGVNTEASPGMWLSRRDGRAHRRVESRPTIAEGIEGGVGELTFRLGLRVIDDVVVVSENAIRKGVREIALRDHMVVEGSGAVGVAALLERRTEGETICVVLTGSNIDRERLIELLMAGPENG